VNIIQTSCYSIMKMTANPYLDRNFEVVKIWRKW